jgi:predicted ATP-grasp superfamily ATP-dependent carboligase
MASPPHIFVHEFIIGGGWPPGELPHGLAGEAAAMLLALLADFRAWGAVHTVTTLDRRLDNLSLPADEIVHVAPGQHQAAFSALLAQSDAALIIAPETDGILAGLSAMGEEAGIPILGSNSVAVAIASDKAICYERFRQAELPTPLTRQTRFAAAPQVADEMGYPLVTKPLDGVGCEGVCLVTRPAGLADALALLRRATRHEEIILQSFIVGTHASVSLLIAEGRALALSLNGQNIESGCPFAYRGGIVPLTHPAAARAFEVAQAAVGLVPGLQGYVGVDLVLTQEEALLIEINPRLTTSYIGLRRVLQFNLAQAIWNACRQGKLPARGLLTHQVTFVKDELSCP